MITSPDKSDIIRCVKVVDQGFRMLELETEKEVTLRMVVWRLFQEAWQTQRTISSPKPQGFKSTMPEYHHTASEIRAVEIELLKDRIVYKPEIKPTATAEALDRYLEVMSWLRYIRARNPEKAKRAFLSLAAGMSQKRVAVIFGYNTIRAVESMRYSALTQICQKVAKNMQKLG